MRETIPYWEVPYLPIDPTDVGRQYEPIVRINSQSGKGGVAYVMETCYGFKLPKGMHKEFADVIQVIAEKQGEVAPEQIYDTFRKEYLEISSPFELIRYEIEDVGMDTKAKVIFRYVGQTFESEALGNGPIDAVKAAILSKVKLSARVLDYDEHALTQGSKSKAATYLHMVDLDTGHTDIRRWRKLQHHPFLDPQYLQRSESSVRIRGEEIRHEGSNSESSACFRYCGRAGDRSH